MSETIKKVALIPARSGSKRIPNKNITTISGHPLLAYTIKSALESQVFDAVVCCTDSELYAAIAKYYGAIVPSLRPTSISGDKSPDSDWVGWILRSLSLLGSDYDVFSILRPTSPFRLSSTIVRAWGIFNDDLSAHSLRAVELCKQHPGKMWKVHGSRMSPILPFEQNHVPWHSCQYASLPDIYVQNASLEFAWTRTFFDHGTISGTSVIPFLTVGLEGFDINNHEDLLLAQHYIASGAAELPAVSVKPFTF